MRAAKPVLVLALLLGGTIAAAQPKLTDQVARETARELVDGKYDAVAARFEQGMRTRIGPAQLAGVVEPLRRERGPARELTVLPRQSGPRTVVEIAWTKGARSQVELGVREDGRIIGILIHDRPNNDYETKTSLRLPFRGTWTAINADRELSNPHYGNDNQRFAVDWTIRDEGLKSFRTDGKHNQDYYAYGQEALATAAGVVAIVIDGVPENPDPGTGQGDRYNVGGNQVVLDLGNGEFALYCHLIPGSIRVHVGDHVTSGQPVGLVGNSGHSTEPHLHFQLMDAARLTVANSLPAKFSHVLVDGKLVARAWPVSGNRVSAP